MSESTAEPASERRHTGSIAAAWAIALVSGLLVLLIVPDHHRAYWLLFAIGTSVIASFLLQLATAEKQGFITRVSISAAGAVLIIAVADIVHLLLG